VGIAANAAALDLDGDGWLDLAAPGFWVLLNQGGGVFAEPVHYAAGSEDALYVFAADFDGDGHEDLCSANGAFWVLRNHGDGTFDEAVEVPTEGVGYRGVTADFDGTDGPDIAAADASGDIVVLLNRGDGTFGEPVTYGAGADATFVLESADLDGDGDVDLVAPRAGFAEVVVLLNQGDGTFSPASYPAGRGVVSLVAADFTGDGKLDLATGNNAAATVAVLLQQADGAFDSAGEKPAHRNTSGVAAADLDLDGDVDIVAGSGGAGSLFLLLNDGAGGFSPLEVDITVGGSVITATADVDANGAPDILIPTTRGVSVVLNTTRPAVSRDSNRDGIPDECEGGFHRGDVNGDGPTDISDGIAVLWSLFASAGPPRCLDAADANDDGALDVSDAIFLLDYLFTGARPPPDPGPAPAACGLDPGARGAGRSPSLGCETYDGC
jgi:hypothetical protein